MRHLVRKGFNHNNVSFQATGETVYLEKDLVDEGDGRPEVDVSGCCEIALFKLYLYGGIKETGWRMVSVAYPKQYTVFLAVLYIFLSCWKTPVIKAQIADK